MSVAVLCVCGFVCDCAFCFCSWLCLLEFATTKPLNTVLLLQVLVQMCMLCWWDCPNLNSTSLWYKLLLPAVVVQVVVVVVCACGCALCLWLCFVPVHVVVAVLLVQPVPVLLCCWSCRIFLGNGKVPFQCPSSPFWFLKKSVALNVAKLFAIAHTFLQSCSLFNAGWVAKSLRFLKESSDFANCNQVILPVLGCFCFCGQVFGATAIDFVGKLAILTRWAARGPPGIIFLCMRESFGPSF